MQTDKLKFSQDVVHVVRDICGRLFNFNANSNQQFEKMIGMDHEQLNATIQQFVDALPEKIFQGVSAPKLEDIKRICAREFVFFQVQEKGSPSQYTEDLANFIHVFSRDIQQQL